MDLNTLKLWVKAVRAYSFSASLVPVAIGGLLARQSGADFSGLRFAVSLAAGLLIHIAANLWNDYYDFKGGVDTVGGGIGSGVLVYGEMTPARCFRGALLCVLLAAAGGLWLASQVGHRILWLGFAGLIGAIAYSAGPLSPKHRALGEVWVFLMMGVGMTLGGTMAQTGTFSWRAVVVGIPAALLMTLILYTNNLRDLQPDRAAGLRTLPMRFKATEAKVLALLLLVLPYAFTGLMAGTGNLPISTLLALLTLPLAIRWALDLWKGPVADKQVIDIAKLHMLFGLLFAVGLWINR